jgi:hypothetical protein
MQYINKILHRTKTKKISFMQIIKTLNKTLANTIKKIKNKINKKHKGLINSSEATRCGFIIAKS